MPLRAIRYVRKMRGGAQAHLLEAEDGHHYVVKFQNNPQHRRILVNELVAGVFLKYLQITAPEIAIIEVTRGFLEENADVHLRLGSQRIAVEPGWHFGSRFPGHPARLAVYDFVPDSLLAGVRNLTDFLGILVFDKWSGNADGRQSIFFRARVQDWSAKGQPGAAKLAFVVMMIDHGFIFNGPNWDFADSPPQGLYARKLVYEQVRSFEDFEPWLERVTHFPEEIVDRALKQVPPEWLAGEEDALAHVLEQMLERRRRVADLLTAARRSKANPFPNWR